MKVLFILSLPALCTLWAGGAWAAAGTRTDASGVLVWAFLFFCALIVIAQLLPAALMLLGFKKGIVKGQTEKTL